MAGAAPAGSGGRAGTPFQHDWEALVRGDALKREDIYRQRVFGNNSGAQNFIEFEDRREFKWYMLILYIIFVLVAYNYSNPRMKIHVYFKINHAVQTSVMNTPFDVDPVARYFDDIKNMQDVQDFLLNAFPVIVGGKVQHFNELVGSVRFTMRKMNTEKNENERFNAFTPKVWQNTAGISPVEASDSDDDQANFGIYRHWQNASLDWSIPGHESKMCPRESERIDKVAFPGVETLAREILCKRWCEQLIYPKTCHCFTISKMADGSCEFFQVPALYFSVVTVEVGLAPQDASENQGDVQPNLETSSAVIAFYPVMKQFEFTADKTGYRKTPGFIKSLTVPSLLELDASGSELGLARMTQPRLLNNIIDDWIQGGYLSDAVSLAIDFATFNPNYDCFTWVQMTFQLTSSGLVLPKVHVESMQVTNDPDIITDWTPAKELYGSFLDLLYLILVIFYVCVEAWEMSCCNRGLKYFTSSWNWLTFLSALLHVATIALWWQYMMDQDFVKELQNLRKTGVDPVFSPEGANQFRALTALGTQIDAHRNFKIVCSFMLFFMLMQLLRYLSDIQPRVAVLMNTVSNSVVPIGFMAFVIITALLGVCICTNVVFGREVKDFAGLSDSIRTIFLLTIGEYGALNGLRENFGNSSFLFYLPYMTFNIIIIVNFPRAVLNASYEDAHATHADNYAQETSRQRAMDTNNNSDWVRMRKMVITFVKGLFPEDFNAKETARMIAKHTQKSKFRRTAMGGYLVFNVTFLAMTYMITRTEKSNRMMATVESAIRSPRFTTTNFVTGELIEGVNFDRIRSRDDVRSFLAKALPITLFDSSHGTFDGAPNFLKEYYSAKPAPDLPSPYQQLLINNWNIVVGQKPIRITSQLSKMTKVGERAIEGVTNEMSLIRETKSTSKPPDPAEVSINDGLPNSLFDGATNILEIKNHQQREAISTYCTYDFGYGVTEISRDGENPDKKGYGFVCMLPVNETETREALGFMASHKFVTDQTLSLAIEFVLYNAYARTFAYVIVWFGFDPSGTIYKDIRVESITLELYDDFLGIVQLHVEFATCLLNLVYLIQLLVTIYRCVRDSAVEKKAAHEGGKGPHGATRVFGWIQTIFCFFLFDLLNPLELISCIVTIITMCFWYNFVLSALAQSYFFMEQPVWIQGQCDANSFTWCSDTEVITQFFTAQFAFRLYIQLCAVNTILVFLRVLRFLRPFPRMHVIFHTFGRAFGDLVWFVVVYVIIMISYTMLGHYIFGTDLQDYATFIDSFRACFEMFLGTVDFEAFSQAPWLMMFFFTVTFWFVLKLLAFNMFLAIIDKNYQEEKAAQKELKNEIKPDEPKQLGYVAYLKSMFTGLTKGNKKSSAESSAKAAEPTPGEATPGEKTDLAVTPTEGKENHEEELEEEDQPEGLFALGGNLIGVIAQEDEDDEGEETAAERIAEDEAVGISREKVKDMRWGKLPEEIKDWAIDKAEGLVRFLAEDDYLKQVFHNKEAALENQDELLAMDNEVLLERAETNMNRKKKELSHEQHRARQELDQAELSELKKVHQDQESLSWYIMKREAELKKLESQKELKKDRFDKLVNAAKSLIDANQEPEHQVLAGSADGMTNGVR